MWTGLNFATVPLINSLGVFDIGGPDWYITEEKIRDTVGLQHTQDFLMGGWGTRLTNISLRAFDHYAQNAKENRFQVWSDSYWKLRNPVKQTELYDLSVITETPFGLFFGANDDTCLPAQSEITRQEMGDMVTAFKSYPGVGHGDFILMNT